MCHENGQRERPHSRRQGAAGVLLPWSQQLAKTAALHSKCSTAQQAQRTRYRGVRNTSISCTMLVCPVHFLRNTGRRAAATCSGEHRLGCSMIRKQTKQQQQQMQYAGASGSSGARGSTSRAPRAGAPAAAADSNQQQQQQPEQRCLHCAVKAQAAHTSAQNHQQAAAAAAAMQASSSAHVDQQLLLHLLACTAWPGEANSFCFLLCS